MIQRAIAKLVERQDLTREEAFEAMAQIMSGNATDSQISAFLVSLRMKGETPWEIAGCADAMRQKAERIESRHRVIVDTCGTGGDMSGTFNISTASAIVASAAGAVVAKHGNRSVSSKCGSADVLQALGVNIELSPGDVARVLDEEGITFLFAPTMHKAMRFAVGVRKELALRTVFNILGPLTNPAGARRQVIGVFSPALTDTMARVLQELGSEHALVVHGEGGLDEMSTDGLTKVSELKEGEVRSYTVSQKDFGLQKAVRAELAGGDAVANAKIIRDILNGKKGAPFDIVLLNTGAALYVGGIAQTIGEGVVIARETILSGKAAGKLDQWIESTHRMDR
jgi:anthranilate phosphoribosyltransferase